jgi:2-polyprenyl-6-methoxyphenol hydroxylase-like FAD-dependent oxidoreductase
MVGWAKERTGFGYIRIKRTDLVEVLLEAIHEAKIPVHYNQRITAIVDTGDGVKVTFSDGSSDIGDLLLGCDGIHSSVRRIYIDPVQVPEYSGFAGIGSIVPASVLSEHAASRFVSFSHSF